MMRRTKEWWARLTPEDRSIIVYFERHQNEGGRSDYLPDDCSDCGVCGNPCLGIGPCQSCSNEYMKAINKAEAANAD